jgi:hypothetical protein
MSTGLSPLMNILKINKINEHFWDELFHLHKILLTAIPEKNRSKWREECGKFHSKHSGRTDL